MLSATSLFRQHVVENIMVANALNLTAPYNGVRSE
jgi:hypothetical protein